MGRAQKEGLPVEGLERQDQGGRRRKKRFWDGRTYQVQQGGKISCETLVIFGEAEGELRKVKAGQKIATGEAAGVGAR